MEAVELMGAVAERLDRIEAALAELLRQRQLKAWYGTEELAQLLGKAEFTVREWCRLGRVNAEKRGSGRGKHHAWVVSHEELLRIQREGLLLDRNRRSAAGGTPTGRK
jgi:hypothetical protein